MLQCKMATLLTNEAIHVRKMINMGAMRNKIEVNGSQTEVTISSTTEPGYFLISME